MAKDATLNIRTNSAVKESITALAGFTKFKTKKNITNAKVANYLIKKALASTTDEELINHFNQD